MTVLAEGDARAARAAGLAGEQLFDLCQLVAIELAAHQRDDALLTHWRLRIRRRRSARLVEREINELVLRELRMEHDVVQSTVAISRFQRRNTADDFASSTEGLPPAPATTLRTIRSAPPRSDTSASPEGSTATANGWFNPFATTTTRILMLLGRIENIRALSERDGRNADVGLLGLRHAGACRCSGRAVNTPATPHAEPCEISIASALAFGSRRDPTGNGIPL